MLLISMMLFGFISWEWDEQKTIIMTSQESIYFSYYPSASAWSGKHVYRLNKVTDFVEKIGTFVPLAAKSRTHLYFWEICWNSRTGCLAQIVSLSSHLLNLQGGKLVRVHVCPFCTFAGVSVSMINILGTGRMESDWTYPVYYFDTTLPWKNNVWMQRMHCFYTASYDLLKIAIPIGQSAVCYEVSWKFEWSVRCTFVPMNRIHSFWIIQPSLLERLGVMEPFTSASKLCMQWK